jgi:methionyl-tRNA synthetase
LNTVLCVCYQTIREVLIGLLPILPHKAAEGLCQLGVNGIAEDTWQTLNEQRPKAVQIDGPTLFHAGPVAASA